jgi:hypothetical protein
VRAGCRPEPGRKGERAGHHATAIKPHHKRIVRKLPPASLTHRKGEGGFPRAFAPAKSKHPGVPNYRPRMEHLPPQNLQNQGLKRAGERFDDGRMAGAWLRPNTYLM